MVKSNSEYKSVQKKLMAAVSMVLVAAIMVVASSYAWFTLSTAPEVTGISTSVGANGNLEIALRTGDLEGDKGIKYNDSAITFPDANTYWGNLIDLSHESYHFDAISLAPARLNATVDETNSKIETLSATIAGTTETVKVGDTYDGGTIKTVTADSDPAKVQITYTKVVQSVYKLKTESYLQVPTYGNDGRLSGLKTEGVINGTYVTDSNGFGAGGANAYGVRAIGVSSNMTPEQMALLAAKQAVSNAIRDSKSAATRSLRDDSVKLADIFVKYYLSKNGGSAATFTDGDVANINSAINNLEAIAVQLRSAVTEAIVAVGVAQGVEVDPATIEFETDAITATTTDGSDSVDWEELTALQAVLIEANTAIDSMETKIEEAQAKAAAIGTDRTWDKISAPLTVLLNVTDFKIISSVDGTAYTVEALMQQFNTNAVGVAQVLLSEPTVSIVGGLYHNVALLSGNYSAPTQMTVNGKFGSINMDNQQVRVVMATSAEEPTTTYDGGSVKGFYLPVVLNQLSTVEPTNSNGGNEVITDYYGYAVDLAFKTNAKGSSLLLQTDARNRVEESEITQGGGSYMQFASGNDDFELDQVATLMENIRVVFMNDDGDIYGVAALDMTAKTTVQVDGVDYIKAPLYLYNFTVDGSGKMTLNGKAASDAITDLTQNEAAAVTAVVYLDGDNVHNEDVAISGSSMTGTMNLQFASNAELDPMDYTFTGEAVGDFTVEEENKVVTITASDGATKYEIYLGDVKVGELSQPGSYTIPAGTDPGTYEVKVVASAPGRASVTKTVSVTIA